jgi:hypothetical protein
MNTRAPHGTGFAIAALFGVTFWAIVALLSF